MTGAGDATGLLGTAIGLGATLLFTGMLIDHVDKSTNKLIKMGKNQNKKRPVKKKSITKRKTAKNINKRVNY